MTARAVETVTLNIWPGGAPGKMLPHSKGTDEFLKSHQSKNTISGIAEPTITVYQPEKPNGTSVIVAPGGGYVFLSAVHEGTQVCEWLNSIGVTGVLLKYRTPTRDEAKPYEKPAADARQAIKVVREHAAEWHLDPKRVGLLGFSAGGNLLGHVACDRGPEIRDVPDFGVMIYGGGFLDPRDGMKLAADFTVPADAPPMFIACAHNDNTNPISSTLLYLEYKKRNLPAELHLFTDGGHGFGMRKDGHPINEWPARCAEWMGSMGWLPTVEKLDAALATKEKALAGLLQGLKPHAPFLCAMDVQMLRAELKDARYELEKAQRDHRSDLIASREAKVQKTKSVLADLVKRLESNDMERELAYLSELKREIAALEVDREFFAKEAPRSSSTAK